MSEAGVRISLLVLSPSLRRCHWSLVTCVPVSVSAYVVSCVRGLELGKWSEARTADREAGGEERRHLGTRSILRPATASQRPERTQPANQRPGPELRDQ